ncbi:MAG: sulfate reduction electron transfer complex DsrMKJOP subunit DsrM [Desulfarculaceae bacterium]|nr:sulfate reduction electron transfer complex DsrMKJOP subunit DsrM [Desulfarculaceae bacterium]
MGFLFSVVAVLVLVGIALVGVGGLGLKVLFGVIIPYAAVLTFFAGLVYRVVDWARSPVPFRIPTTCGQEKSLPWIKPNKIDNPCSGGMVLLRMAFEVLTFRSLFRNMKLDYRQGPTIRYSSEKFLWLFAMMFHWAFLVVIIRHARLFTEPIAQWLQTLEHLDGFLEFNLATFGIGLPTIQISGLVLLGGVSLLLVRRIVVPSVRYISLAADWFPLFLITFIALTGILARYVIRIDVVKVKELAMGLATFHPVVPDGISVWFYVHFFLVCVLFAYFPFSKLMHLGGVFLSPTRNMVNNSRAVLHVNPWNYPVKTHDYHEYEDDFREEMVEAGLPVEKTLEEAEAEKAPAAPAPAEAEVTEEKED